MDTAKSTGLLLATIPLAQGLAIQKAHAEPIIPANDGIGTIAEPEGNTIEIRGGTLSRDGANLFHSFEQFGLNSNQIANFISHPEIKNILGRVVGGNPSLINGLIQVTGGNSHLFLINPAGLIFGTTARLNVPASFTATTANSISFGRETFNANGENNYAALVGTPNTFTFNSSQPAAIINAGQLAVNTEQNLTLLGGTVISTGSLSAPGGTITVAAIPGQNEVRISQEGHLLSLEVLPALSAPEMVNPASLAKMLTGDGEKVTGMKANPDGTVELASGLVVLENTASIISGSLDVAGFEGGSVNVVGNTIGLIDAQIDASGSNGGGTVRIGGDRAGRGTFPNAQQTYVSRDSTINADGLQGDGGTIIIWSDRSTRFDGKISARGGSSGNGGFAEVSGKEDLLFQGEADLRADNGRVGNLLLDPTDITIVDTAPGTGDVALPNILLSDFLGSAVTISRSALESLAGTANVRLEASNDITIAPMSGNAINFTSGTGAIAFIADADGDGVGSFSMNPTDTIFAQERSVTISGASVDVGSIQTFSTFENGGDISLTATNGDVVTNGNLVTESSFGNGGAIALASANGNITLNGDLDANSFFGNGGTVTATATNGSITGNTFIDTSSNSGNGNDVNLTTTNGDIQVSSIYTGSTDATGGNVNITSSGLVRVTGGIFGGSSPSISTADSTTGGAIAILHGGTLANTPFIVGDATNK